MSILSLGMKLSCPVGPWEYVDKKTPWFFDPSTDQLLQKNGNLWFSKHHIPYQCGRQLFSQAETPCKPPATAFKAMVYMKGQNLVCNVYCSIATPPNATKTSLCDFLFSSTDLSAHWCFTSYKFHQLTAN